MDIQALQARREQRRRAIRRRRRLAACVIAAVVAVAAAIVVVADGSGGSSPGPRSAAGHARASTPGARRSATAAGSTAAGSAARERAHRPARDRPRPDPHVPRDRRPARGRAVPGAVRAAGGVRRTDAGAQERRLARGDARPGGGLLAPRRAARGGQADRDQLRQRLQLPVHAGAAGAAAAGLGGRREPPADGPAAVAGRARARADPRSAGGGLGARHAGDQPRRPDHAGRRTAALPGGRRAGNPPAPLPRPRQLVLLPLRRLRPDGRRRGEGGRLQRLHDRRARLGAPERRPLSPAPPARARRDHRRGAAGTAGRHSRRPRQRRRRTAPERTGCRGRRVRCSYRSRPILRSFARPCRPGRSIHRLRR